MSESPVEIIGHDARQHAFDPGSSTRRRFSRELAEELRGELIAGPAPPSSIPQVEE